MVKVVEKLYPGMIDRANDFKSFGDGSEEIFGIFFGVDVLEKQGDVGFGGEIRAVAERVHAGLMGYFPGDALDAISTQDDERGALQFFRGGQEFLEIP